MNFHYHDIVIAVLYNNDWQWGHKSNFCAFDDVKIQALKNMESYVLLVEKQGRPHTIQK